MLVMQSASLPVGQLPGLKLEPIAVEQATTKFDLTLSLTEQEDGLDGRA